MGVRRKDELQKLQNVRKVEHSVPAASSPTQIPWQKEKGKKERKRERKDMSSTEPAVSSGLSLSRVRLFATPWTVAQAPPSTGFSRQEYWSGLPFPSPGDLPDPGIKPRSPALQADYLTSEPPGKPWKLHTIGQITTSSLYTSVTPQIDKGSL